MRDLYRACHPPAPIVLVAPSAPEFVRIVLSLGQRSWPSGFFLLMLVAYNVFALGLASYAMSQALEQGLTRSVWIGLVLVAYVSISFAGLSALTIRIGCRAGVRDVGRPADTVKGRGEEAGRHGDELRAPRRGRGDITASSRALLLVQL